MLECVCYEAVTVLDARSIGKAAQPVKQKTCQINEVREEKTHLANDPETEDAPNWEIQGERLLSINQVVILSEPAAAGESKDRYSGEESKSVPAGTAPKLSFF